MGTCFSKKKLSSNPLKPSSSSSSSVLNGFNVALSSTVVVPLHHPVKAKLKQSPPPPPQHQPVSEEGAAVVAPPKREVFLIKHRKSHDDRDRSSKPTPNPSDHDDQSDTPAAPAPASAAAQIRTSSCTKEELDAILIQCGRLSRSSSGKAASSSAAAACGRRYSGSKRSFDFDNGGGEDGAAGNDVAAEDDGATAVRDRERQQRRSRHSPSPQGRRRRTPSRERERENNNNNNGNSNQRSSSRERRVSRSPGRRGTAAESSDSASAAAANVRPGKMVSVPATVSSLDKSNNGEPVSGSVKRITVKRNVGDAAVRSAASPRTQSPSRAKASIECQQQQGASLSRNSSRKAEISPYRRNPLSEIDPNSLVYPNRSQSRGKREIEVSDDTIIVKEQYNVPIQGLKPNPGSNPRTNKTTTKEQLATVETTVVVSGPQTVTRTRSARRSRDLDFNPEVLLNPNKAPSYTSLLLEDIHNFHQKNTNTTAATPVGVTLPACLTKACSILEAVADLNNNSSTAASSNLSCAFSEDQYSKTYNNLGGPKDPFVESEVGCDDLMEPSFHKYVTVRRGAGVGVGVGVDAEDQESSGSNSFVCGGSSQLNNWGLSPSSWEPNSADSTDCTSRSREDEKLSGRKRETCSSSGGGGGGIGRGRLGLAKGLNTTTTTVVAATAATT